MERWGLDISNWQNGISFDALQNARVDFLILRVGYTGISDGISKAIDDSFESFYKQAKERGIPVGAYWYSCANTYEKGWAEAEYMYENGMQGKQFEFPIYIDVEDPTWQSNNKEGVTQAIKGFFDYFANKGYYVGVYASDISGFQDKINIDEIQKWDKWVARYGSEPKYVKKYGMWQYTSEYTIDGWNGNLDANYSYEDYPDIMKANGWNGFEKEEPMPEPITTTTPIKFELQIGNKTIRLSGEMEEKE